MIISKSDGISHTHGILKQKKTNFSLQNQMNWEEFIRENTLLVVSDFNLLNTIPLSKR